MLRLILISVILCSCSTIEHKKPMFEKTVLYCEDDINGGTDCKEYYICGVQVNE